MPPGPRRAIPSGAVNQNCDEFSSVAGQAAVEERFAVGAWVAGRSDRTPLLRSNRQGGTPAANRRIVVVEPATLK